ncbi:MAG TPA: MFS transporter [Candidatus Saccharimonadales bacterium]|nr:MFS transporter [Candidatus Saccharimonadales bacterium]
MTTKQPAHPTHSAQHHASGFSHRRRTIALIVVALAFVMDLLDSTIVNIAIPSIQSNLGASYATIQWLVAGYSLAFATLLITGGRMGDVFGYKKLFMAGVGGFTLASLLSGAAWNPEVLIGARLLQGAMAALMVPQVMSLMQVMYKPHERNSVNGLFGALGGLSAALGPIVGGLLIKANLFGLDWRPIFLINVPIGIFGLLAALKYLPNGKSAHPLKLDWWGTVIVVVALFLLVFPLIEGRDLGWPHWTFAMIAGAVPILLFFAWQQRRKMARDGSPLVVPALFRFKSFSIGLLTNVVFEGAMLGFFLTITLVMQIGLGFSVIRAALTGIPTAVGIALSIGLFGQKLIPKLGRYASTLGAVIMIAGLSYVAWLIHHYGLAVHPWQFAPGFFVVGTGMGLVMMPIFAVVLNDVDPSHAGSASGILNAVQQVGGAVGIAVIGVIFFGQLSHHAPQSFDSVTPRVRAELSAAHVPADAQDEILKNAKACYVDRSSQKDSAALPESCKKLEGASEPGAKAVGQVVQNAITQANAANFDHAFRWGVTYEIILSGIVLLMSFLLPRHIRPQHFEDAL